MSSSAYGLIDPFRLLDAAYLLCGHNPLRQAPRVSGNKLKKNDPYRENRDTASILIDELKNDVKAGKLPAVDRDGKDAALIWREEPVGPFGKGSPFRGYYESTWFVMRHDLKDWVTKRGQKPDFLFPEVKPQPASSVEDGNAAKQQANKLDADDTHQVLLAYDLVTIFSLNNAAYFLLGLAPLQRVSGAILYDDPDEKVHGIASVLLGQLLHEVKTGKLKATESYGEGDISATAQRPRGRLSKNIVLNPEGSWFVTRHDLKDWVTKKGQKPDFLFPEVKPQPASSVEDGNAAKQQANKSYANHMHQEIGGVFTDEDYASYDPATKGQIMGMFPIVSIDEWEKLFDKAERNGLKPARVVRGKKGFLYHPVKVAEYLIKAKAPRYPRSIIIAQLRAHLPARSKHLKDNLFV